VAERQDWLVWVRGSLAVGNLLLDLVLVPRYAAMGAAWAVLVVATAEAVLLGWLAWRLGAAAPLSGLGLAVSAGAVSSGSAWLALGDRTDAVGLAIALVTATAAYIGILAVCRFFRPEDAEVVAPLLQRMPLPMRGPGRRLLGVR
jgi:O-antigen/teichoic acid export membrane protein